MSRKYKFHNPEGIYFVSFATVYWIDVFIREQYFATMAESLEYIRKIKVWCFMHFVFYQTIPIRLTAQSQQ
jgi:putative transposase